MFFNVYYNSPNFFSYVTKIVIIIFLKILKVIASEIDCIYELKIFLNS